MQICPTQVTAVSGAYVTPQQLQAGPTGIAWDSNNDLYVATSGTNGSRSVVKVPPGGGPGQFQVIVTGVGGPLGLCKGPNGNLFLADGVTGGVYEFTLAGARVDTSAAPGAFQRPLYFAFCGEDLLVADNATNEVYVLRGAGASGSPGPIQPRPYSGPYPELWGIALDATGNLMAAGGSNGAVYKTPAGSQTPEMWGSTGGGVTSGIAIDDAGNVYVAEGYASGDIVVFAPTGGIPAARIPLAATSVSWIAFSPSFQVHGADRFDSLLFVSSAGGGAVPALGNNIIKYDVAGFGGSNGLAIPRTNCSTRTDVELSARGRRFSVELSQNEPNPFAPRTFISYAVPNSGPARLVIYDVAGRRLKTLVDGVMPAGRNATQWDGTDDPASTSTGCKWATCG